MVDSHRVIQTRVLYEQREKEANQVLKNLTLNSPRNTKKRSFSGTKRATAIMKQTTLNQLPKQPIVGTIQQTSTGDRQLLTNKYRKSGGSVQPITMETTVSQSTVKKRNSQPYSELLAQKQALQHAEKSLRTSLSTTKAQ